MSRRVAIIGAGPAGLMAADVISAAGIGVDIYDAMASPARKFLRAGVGGLNLTHAEAETVFRTRYGEQQERVSGWLAAFGQNDVRRWADELGVETFVGSSGRVFPVRMKAAPLLRAWLARLHARDVQLHLRHRWRGWDDTDALCFDAAAGAVRVDADGTAATLLALGGGSWARLGSDGRWVDLLAQRGVTVSPLKPANCGFDIDWSDHLRDRFAGQAVKAVHLSAISPTGSALCASGDCVVTRHGLEGGPIYALAAGLRDSIAATGTAIVYIDLLPGRSLERIASELQQARGRDSLATHLRRRIGIEGVKAALLREVATSADLGDSAQLARLIKSLPLTLTRTRPIDEAISTAGGIVLNELDDDLMLSRLPGVFCAGEMLDWEAPTGGYLLTACLASGSVAARGILARLALRNR